MAQEKDIDIQTVVFIHNNVPNYIDITTIENLAKLGLKKMTNLMSSKCIRWILILLKIFGPSSRDMFIRASNNFHPRMNFGK